MRSGAVRAMLAAILFGVVTLTVVAASDERELAFTLGVDPAQVAAVLGAGQTACQGPLDVPVDAELVRFRAGFERAPQPLRVSVRDAGRTTSARVEAARPGRVDLSAAVRGLRAGRQVALCITNESKRRVTLYGGAAHAAPASALTVDGGDAAADLALTFARERPRSMIATLPDVIARASLFHFSWAGAWLYWSLLFLIVCAVPLLIGLALGSTSGSDLDHGTSRRQTRSKRMTADLG